jgi:gag-polyprotein putative aspartyl protease
MPRLDFTISHDEMSVPAVVGLNDLDAASLLKAGGSIPAPVHVRAVLDTGCSVTAVAPHVFGQLGLAPVIAGSSQTASGSVAVNLYRVSLSVFDVNAGPMMTLRDLLVSELTTALGDIDVLLGMDVLLTCKLLLDGPARHFSLDS